MSTFDEQMTQQQVSWRRANVTSREWGQQNGKRYEWILPHSLWEGGLWAGIRGNTDHSLTNYLRDSRVQKHLGVHNLKSSWMLCANLYFPFGRSDQGLGLLAGFLRDRVHADIRSVDRIELEYAESGDLRPSALLGSRAASAAPGKRRPTSPFW